MAAPAGRRSYELPAGEATETLRLFAKQSGEQIVYPVEQVRGCHTRAVHGRFGAAEAIEAMLDGSGLAVVKDPASGAFTVRRAPPSGPAKPLGPTGAPTRAPAPRKTAAADPADDEIVSLGPFDVRSTQDRGYRAANAVSATQVAVPIRQLPMNISVFTESFIDDQRAYDLYDVIKWAPGVHQDNTSPQGWIRYSIRGYTSAAVQRDGFGSFRFVDTANIARVEVVKGPASLLYGQINPGGVVNYITKQPESKPAVHATVSAGTAGYDRELVDATGPVGGAESPFLYRLVAMREEVPEFHQTGTGTKTLLAPSVGWKIGRDANLRVEFEHFSRRDQRPTGGVVLVYVDGVGSNPYGGLPWNFSYAGDGDYQNFESDVLTAEFTARLTTHANLRVAYADSSWDMEWRATGQGATGLIPQSFIDYYYPPDAKLTPRDTMFRRNRWEHQWGDEQAGRVDLSGEFRLGTAEMRPLIGWKGTFRSRFRWRQRSNPNVAGSPFYVRPWDLRNPATWSRAVPFGVDALTPTTDSTSATHNGSVYAVLSATLLDEKLRLLGGYARHTLHNDPTVDTVAQTYAPPTDRAANVPQFGALYALTPALAPFVTYSESFQANTSTLRVNNVPRVPASPSIGKGVDAGVKFDWFGGRLSGVASVYQVTASPTGIVSVTTGIDASGVTLFSDIQGGKQRSRGAEIELLYTPVDAFQVIAAYSTCDAVYEKHPISPALDGSRLVATPDQTLGIWGKYSVPTGAFRGLSFAAGLNYVGRASFVGNNPTVRSAAYATVDVSVGYRFFAGGRNWNAELMVKNVADAHYYPSASSWGYPRHAILSVSTQL
jgi:iron complex outermembrane receptor protein